MKLLLSIFILGAFLQAKTISIIGTADLQGAMEPSIHKVDLNGDGKREKVQMGGIARLAELYKELKSKNPNSVIVSSGDDLMNSYFHIFKGKAIFSLMSDAGYEILALGNHEFDKGTKVLANALKSAKFTTLCSDLNVNKSPLNGACKRYLIKDFNGTKVGFFSLITESLLDATSAKDISFRGNNVQIAKEMIKLLKEKGANVIVLISHIGYKEDVKLAKQVKGIDMIFGGHSHHYVKKMGHIGKTAIVNGGELGSKVIVVNIPIENNRAVNKKITMQTIPVTEKYAQNRNILKKIAQYNKKLPKTIVLGKTKKDWVMYSKVLRKQESPVADMINDLLREKYKVDIVLNNGGAFRGNKLYSKGYITNKMLKEIDEFGNYAYMFTLKGKYIKPILEHSAAQYGKGGFLQVSGLRYKIDLRKKMQKVQNGKVVQKGERVSNIKVLQNGKWEDVDPNKDYKVLTNSFVAQKGGDGYFWFPKYAKDAQNSYATFYSIMAEEVNKKGELTPKDTDGRIEIVH